MQGFLMKAFTAAHDAVGAIFQKTVELCDYANFMGFRLMMDSNFMRIDPHTPKGVLQKGAWVAYELGRRSALDKVSGTFKEAMNNPHGAPKVSLKSLLKDAAEAAMPYLTKPNVLVPLVVAASATVLGLMMYTSATGHLPHMIDDVLAPFLGNGTGNALRGTDVTPTPPDP